MGLIIVLTTTTHGLEVIAKLLLDSQTRSNSLSLYVTSVFVAGLILSPWNVVAKPGDQPENIIFILALGYPTITYL